jgi:hypothetical protein
MDGESGSPPRPPSFVSMGRRQADVGDRDVRNVIGDGDHEVLAGLVFADHLAHGRGADDDGGQQLFGGGQQLVAGAGRVGGQDGVAAGDQPLAGVVRAGDLGQVCWPDSDICSGPPPAMSF